MNRIEKVYSRCLTWCVPLLMAGLTAGCGGGQDPILGAGVAPETIRPTVTLTSPVAGATNVAINSKITATFSEDMDPASITGATVTLTGPGASPVAGTVTYSAGAKTTTFTPTNPATLPASTLMTGTITSGARDLAGNALAGNVVWTFTTGAAPDTTAPTVISADPANAATGVAVNKKIAAAFSEAMDPATITAASFTVTGPGTASVPGLVTYAAAGNTASFSPASNLTANTLYTATIGTQSRDLAGNALAGNFAWTFTTGAAPDTTAPTVISTDPANTAVGVAVNKKITAVFSEAMDPATISTGTFTLARAGTTPVSGTVTYAANGTTAAFTPTGSLAANTSYTATISTGSRDMAGNALAGNVVWTFTTGVAPDTTAPTVTATDPANAAAGVAFNKKITAVFSEAMDPATISTASFTLAGPGTTPVSGMVTYAAVGTTATFTPTASLLANSLYTATIGTMSKDLAGNAMAGNVTWTFTTGAAPDTAAPTILSTNPADGASGVCSNAVNATFSETMDASTITTASFRLAGPGTTTVAGITAYNATTGIATFTPTTPLAAGTTFIATIDGGNSGVKDLAGNALANNKIWTFTTGTQAACSPVTPPVTPSPVQPVALGAATTFGGFGGAAGMTNQGTLTVINGDIGTVAASSTMTGFHDTGGNVYTETGSNIGTVNGKIYTAPPLVVCCPGDGTEGTATTFQIATQARADAQNAWSNILSPAAMPGGTDPGAGQLGGLTLFPGVYQAAGGTFQITGSDLTLDGQGNANATWVFQTASSLTVGAPGAPRSVQLINGAQAKNVFWRVGTAATINGAGGGTMVGTIIADAGVTFSTAGNAAITTLNGRALGLNASVTLVNTRINVPAP
ncbi:Ig-like domain-containing protein [Noviherbaspirillum sp.]|uniref:Ig-like domain-containing protein n=1 Tax=Noviherbaspirillum sp. TaxID=1926288 RepID=UPI002FE07940